MNLQVNSRSKERTVLIEKTITFYAKYLGINKADVNLFVFPRKSMRTKEKRLGCINNSPWGLILSIDNKLHVHRLISVLAHEMIHAKQIIRGEIKFDKYRNGRLKHIWKGEVVRLPYHKQPWEIEAYTKEDILVDALIKEVNKNKAKKK